MLTMTTVQKSNASGRTVIVAKGGGKQRTVNYDHALDLRENHRTALHTLAAALHVETLPRVETVEVDKGRSRFVIG